MELQGGAKVMADKKKTVLDDSRILFVEEKKVPLKRALWRSLMFMML